MGDEHRAPRMSHDVFGWRSVRETRNAFAAVARHDDERCIHPRCPVEDDPRGVAYLDDPSCSRANALEARRGEGFGSRTQRLDRARIDGSRRFERGGNRTEHVERMHEQKRTCHRASDLRGEPLGSQGFVGEVGREDHRTRPWPVAHDEHRTRGVAKNPLGCASEEGTFERALPASADDEESRREVLDEA